MIKSIIHSGGESTRMREAYDGPKALAPVDGKPLLWYHMQPFLRSNLVREYLFTLRHMHETVQSYVDQMEKEFGIQCKSIVENVPLGRAGVIRLAIEKGLVDTNSYYLMSHPDDLVPIDVKRLFEYAIEAESRGKSIIVVMARHAPNPFGIGEIQEKDGVMEILQFREKPELPFIDNHYANTGMMLFLPEAMKEFRKVPSGKLVHPEDEIIPRLVSENKVAAFPVDRWLSINYKSDYKKLLTMGSDKLLKFLSP
ncbi:MAG: hypothetical protein JW700_03400 [Candidatus Aenigmarchaeota archaeon]|nr:hypothetical protein [Candidatus Aenigmarchaeota archaeon]